MRSLKVQFANLEGVSPESFGFSAELVLLAEYDNEKGGIPGYTRAYDVAKGDRWGNRLAVFTKADMNISISEIGLAYNEIALHVKCGEQNIIAVHLLSTSSCENSDKVRAQQIQDIADYSENLENVTIVGDFNCCSSPNLVAKAIGLGVKEFRGAIGSNCQNALKSLSSNLQLQNPGMRSFPTFKPVRGKIYFPAPVLCLDQVWSSGKVQVVRERFANLSDHFGLTLSF